MTAYAERCEREDEEDRCGLLNRTIQACDPPSRDNHLCAICNTYIGGTSLVAQDRRNGGKAC